MIRNQLGSGRSIYDLMLKVTYYARVSTEKDEQAHSLKNQIYYYSDYIKNNSNWTYVEGYVDEGLSGTSVNKREDFLRMIADAKKGKFDFIITKEISRFSRNTLDSIKYTQELLSCGVGVLFQSDNINTLLPDAELRLTIMASIAQDEVRKLSERVKFGFKRAIEKGVVLGSSNIWGYKKVDGKLEIIEEQAVIVREIFELYAVDKLGIRAICKRFNDKGLKNGNSNPFSFSTVRGILSNPKYKGYYCGNKTHKYDYKLNKVKHINEDEWVLYKAEDAVPAIVSEELWEKANFILKQRSDKMTAEDKTSYQNKYSYSGKIICSEHNVPYYRSLYRYTSGNKEVWQCKKYNEFGKAGCVSPTVYTSELDLVMKEVFNTVFQEKAKFIHDLVSIYTDIMNEVDYNKEAGKLKKQIGDIMKLKDKLLEFSLNGKLSDDEFEARNNRFNEEIENIRLSIQDIQEQEHLNIEMKYNIENIRQALIGELNFENGVDSELVGTLLDKVIVCTSDNKSGNNSSNNSANNRELNLKVHLKASNDKLNYTLNRARHARVF